MVAGTVSFGEWDTYVATMRRCTTCILPETFPGITFNAEGVCNYCLAYEPVKVRGEQELENVLARYRNKGEKYDCIAPISGGLGCARGDGPREDCGIHESNGRASE